MTKRRTLRQFWTFNMVTSTGNFFKRASKIFRFVSKSCNSCRKVTNCQKQSLKTNQNKNSECIKPIIVPKTKVFFIGEPPVTFSRYNHFVQRLLNKYCHNLFYCQIYINFVLALQFWLCFFILFCLSFLSMPTAVQMTPIFPPKKLRKDTGA